MSNKVEADAFRKIMAEHAPYVWRVLRGLGVREADLPDISQETFLVVHRQLDAFEGRSSLRTWICGIAMRVASDYRRKAYRRREFMFDTPPEVSAAAPQQPELERRQAWELLGRVLEGLGEDHRRVFILYEVEQQPMKDVAAALEIPLSTAYSRLHAARELVQQALRLQQLKAGAAL